MPRFAPLCIALLRFASLCLARFASFCVALFRFAQLRFASFCFALLGFASLCFALLRLASLCFALLRFASLSFALLRSAPVCFALLRLASLWSMLPLGPADLANVGGVGDRFCRPARAAIIDQVGPAPWVTLTKSVPDPANVDQVGRPGRPSLTKSGRPRGQH